MSIPSIKPILLILSAALLSSCGTLSKSECLTADWRLIGYEDGSKGYTANRIGEHRKSCADHGVKPNLAAYQNGWAEGVKIYCTANNGYKVGLNGHRYNNVCPSNLEGDFIQAYNAGHEIYLARVRYNENIRAQKNIRADLASIDQEIADKEHSMRYEKLNKHQRNDLYDSLKQLAIDRATLDIELRNLEDEGLHLRRDLDEITRANR